MSAYTYVCDERYIHIECIECTYREYIESTYREYIESIYLEEFDIQ